MSINRLDYCQYLLSTQTNYTITNFADHSKNVGHDSINRYLGRDKLTPRLIWELVKTDVIPNQNGFIIFDDTVADKNFSHNIEGARSQYSGNTHGIIKGIGIVNCVYLNPELNQYWIIDYRVFNPDCDGKTKPDHVVEMLHNLINHKYLDFSTILMDSWYATKDMMLMIEDMNKLYYCPIKTNRLVDDSGGKEKYKPVSELTWSDLETNKGKRIKINGFPKDHKVQLFRVPVATNRTDYVVTNDISCSSSSDAREACAKRWKIEQFHRELKQTTGIEKCQCRKARIQRNHIACAMLVWVRLKQIAYQTKRTVYQIKQGLLDDYLTNQLRNPVVRMGGA